MQLFKGMDRSLDAAHFTPQATGQPVILAQAVEHGATDPLHRIGLELCAQTFFVAGYGIQQAKHAILDDVLHLHARRELGHQVVGDSFNQRRVSRNELVLIECSSRVIHYVSLSITASRLRRVATRVYHKSLRHHYEASLPAWSMQQRGATALIHTLPHLPIR